MILLQCGVNMTRAATLIKLYEVDKKKPNFDATINGFHIVVYDESENVVDEKVISLVGTDDIQEAINDFIEAINFMKKHNNTNHTIWLSEPII